MGAVKMVVLYPRPTDIEAFERLYRDEHMPIAARNLKGATKFVATRILASPQGATPAFHRIAEIHFASRETLEGCAASEGGKETLAHALRISSGGPPLIFIAEEDTSKFSQVARG